MEKLVSLCKRRGFIFPSSEIYGGLGSTWDYGPLGVELKRNIKEVWWKSMVWDRDDIVGLDTAILMNPKVWIASGHAENFIDPLIECRNCNSRLRADKLTDGQVDCPNCGELNTLTEPRQFNLMLETHLGPLQDSGNKAWLRPETAQGIFVNFQNVQSTTRRKLPFGIAQIGKSFRNEITVGNFIFRTREFEQMEMEFFVKPGTDENWHKHWVQTRYDWYVKLGINSKNIKIREHAADQLAHYAKATSDIEYKFPWGWDELEGIANRANFDLKSHAKHSGHELKYFDQEENTHYYPFVIEPSGGVDRSVLAFLLDAYTEETVRTATKDKTDKRLVMKLDKSIAPIKVAILPLSRNEQLAPIAHQVYELTKGHGWLVQYDDTQSIGRRYRRQDEAGTPFCITVDFESIEDKKVTLRDRDNMKQDRISIDILVKELIKRLK